MYACQTLDEATQACMEWVVIDSPAPILPDFTIDEWNTLAVIVVLVIISAWGFRVLGGLIK